MANSFESTGLRLVYKLSKSVCKLTFVLGHVQENPKKTDVAAASTGSAFFGKIKISSNGSELYGIATSSHVLGDGTDHEALPLNYGKTFNINICNPETCSGKQIVPVIIGLHTGFIFTSEELGFTFIELTANFRQQHLDHHGIEYLPLEASGRYIGQPILVPQLPEDGELKFSSGHVKTIRPGVILHSALGAMGLPGFDAQTGELLFMHKGQDETADRINSVFNDFEQLRHLYSSTVPDPSGEGKEKPNPDLLIKRIIEQLGKLIGVTEIGCQIAVPISSIVDFILHRFDIITKLDIALREAICNGSNCSEVEKIAYQLEGLNAGLEHLRSFDETPLHFAAGLGLRDIVECLLQCKPLLLDVKTRVKGESALTIAAKTGAVEVVQLLLNYGAKLDLKTVSENALGAAAFGGHCDVLRLLLEQGKSSVLSLSGTKNSNGETCLHRAAAGGDRDVLNFVIKAFDLDSTNSGQIDMQDNAGRTALLTAAAFGQPDSVDILLDAGADLEFRLEGTDTELNGMAIHLAAGAGHAETVQRLLRHCRGGEWLLHATDSRTNKPLWRAAYGGSLDAFLVLYNFATELYGSVTIDFPAMLQAAAIGDKTGDLAKWLLDKGAEMSSGNPGGMNVLHYSEAASTLQVFLDDMNVRPGLLQSLLMEKEYHDGETPLMFAIRERQGGLKIVELLLQASKKLGDEFVVQMVNEPNNDGNTPLHYTAYAATGEVVAIASLLLECGANIEAENSSGSTVLHFASIMGKTELVHLLLTRDREIGRRLLTTKDRYTGDTALMMAVSCNQGSVAKCLLEFEAQEALRSDKLVSIPNYKGYWPLHIACSEGYGDLVEMLLHYGADILETRDENTALHFSARFRRAEATLAVLEGAVSVDIGKRLLLAINDDGLSALHEAAHAGALAVVKIVLRFAKRWGCLAELLELRQLAENSRSGFTPLLIAVASSNAEIVRCLLDANADIDAKLNGYKAIHFAAGAGDYRLVRLLLDHKSGGSRLLLEATDSGETPLYLAASCDHLETVRILVDFAKDLPGHIHQPAVDGTTPLIVAAANGHVQIVEHLLSVGASLVALNSQTTAVHVAVVNGHIDVVDTITKFRPGSEEIRVNSGSTPLLTAALCGQVSIVRKLVDDFGAHLIEAKDYNGHGVYFYAVHCEDENSKQEMVKMLNDLRQKKQAGDSSPDSGISPTGSDRLSLNQKLALAAAEAGHPGKLHRLLEEDRNLCDVRSASGNTLLHVAARSGNINVMLLLLMACGEKVSLMAKTKNDAGQTPIQTARACGHFEVVQLLAMAEDTFATLGNFRRRVSSI